MYVGFIYLVTKILTWQCSILGAVIAGVGYYTVQWGQTREDEKGKETVPDDEKVPLLQEADSQV